MPDSLPKTLPAAGDVAAGFRAAGFRTDDTLRIDTPIGLLRIAGTADAVTGLTWAADAPGGAATDGPGAATPAPLLRAAEQLRAYFAGDLSRFDLPLDLGGTAYQRRVWQALLDIPFGQTVTYGMIARAIASGARSVGTACGRNNIAVIVPCHRVVGAGDGLGGYSGTGGLDTKRWLLRHEGAAV